MTLPLKRTAEKIRNLVPAWWMCQRGQVSLRTRAATFREEVKVWCQKVSKAARWKWTEKFATSAKRVAALFYVTTAPAPSILNVWDLKRLTFPKIKTGIARIARKNLNLLNQIKVIRSQRKGKLRSRRESKLRKKRNFSFCASSRNRNWIAWRLKSSSAEEKKRSLRKIGKMKKRGSSERGRRKRKREKKSNRLQQLLRQRGERKRKLPIKKDKKKHS